MPAEPPQQSTAKVATIRFRWPSGETAQRRFLATDRLAAVLDFAAGHGYFADEYKILTSWPRRDLTGEPDERTLEEMKLWPQETLTLEQR